MTWTDCWTLGIATAAIAGALIMEHLMTGRRGWPSRWYYAEGLVTVLAGLLGWAVLRGVTITPLLAVAMVVAGCLSGVPDFLLLWREQVQMERKWAALEAANMDLANQLRCLMSKQVNSRYMGRLRQMVESAAFAAATMKQEREMLELAERQAQDLLSQIQGMVG